ncbi:surface carbohydrate biosynthesis protein [Desulfogranum marinum]|uniref:surface carbohydrate biosynthesis protein n=1 Tax=Desulfogranum marinum TaxID=453220 RepID=UPI00196671A6|nr:surface carbohydrate biosynthesis protein [Desulfogranum marinum]MBM9513001.1 hypothetical protein [Desulfogranum marinum]
MRTGKKAKHIYVPIEIKVREFDAKLFFSLVAAENGYRVVFGDQKKLRRQVTWWPRGIYLDKSAAATKVKWFKFFRSLGHKVAAWDEEGLIIHEDTYLDRRFSGTSFRMLETFFAWGDCQAGLIKQRYSDRAEMVAVVGNPRMDMLRPEVRGYYNSQANAIKQKYGNIILINTNFSFYNHFMDSSLGKKVFLKNHPEMGEQFVDGWIDYQRTIFQSFVELLPLLEKKFPDHTIVIRPHPAEKHSTWHEVAKEFKNVKVVHENNVIEWLLASKAVIHSNCTTGVEAFLLDKPVIAYRPIISEHYESYLANLLSIGVTKSEELLSVLQKSLDGGQSKSTSLDEKRILAGKYIAAMDGTLATEKIVACLNGIAIEKVGPKLKGGELAHRAFREILPFSKRFYNELKSSLGTLLAQMKKGAKGDGKTVFDLSREVHKQKIPELTLQEIQQSVENFRSVLGRFEQVEVYEVGDGCFEIVQP